MRQLENANKGSGFENLDQVFSVVPNLTFPDEATISHQYSASNLAGGESGSKNLSGEGASESKEVPRDSVKRDSSKIEDNEKIDTKVSNVDKKASNVAVDEGENAENANKNIASESKNIAVE